MAKEPKVKMMHMVSVYDYEDWELLGLYEEEADAIKHWDRIAADHPKGTIGGHVCLIQINEVLQYRSQLTHIREAQWDRK